MYMLYDMCIWKNVHTAALSHTAHTKWPTDFFCHSDWIGYVKNKCMEHVWIDGWKLYTEKRITTQPTLYNWVGWHEWMTMWNES